MTVAKFMLVLILAGSREEIGEFDSLEACRQTAHKLTNDPRPFSVDTVVFQSAGGTAMAFCREVKSP